VKLSRDIKVATVYLSIYNTKDDLHTQEIYKKIIKQKKILRYKMGSMLKSKYVPDLRFQLDLSLKNYDDINKLLKQ
jgi:ribosome-binding factor A